MGLSSSFKQAQDFYKKKWAPERREVLKDLKSIRDEIQQQTKIQSIGSITSSSVCLVGGGLTTAGIIAAPFTFGVSLGLTLAGIATSLTSRVVSVIHDVIKREKVKKQCNDAITCLRKHNESEKEMTRLFELFKQDIKTKKANIRDRNKLKTCYQNYSSEGEKLYTSVEGFVEAVEELVDSLSTTGNSHTEHLESLIRNAVELSKFNEGQLCSAAKKLQKVIEQMEHEYGDLTQHFS